MPFSSIGIALSGGGYKAASYHLGVVSYLWHLGLEKNITTLSTVSGGTIFGAAFLKSRLDKKDFKTFFIEHYNFLKDVNMLDKTLEYLSGYEFDVPSGRRNMITAASRVYSDLLLNKEGSELLFEDLLNPSLGGVRDFIINTTDLSFGLDFRFQKYDNNLSAGNNKIKVPRESVLKISVSDMVAASTCYPGTLDPIGFPFDFRWEKNQVPYELKKIFIKDGIPESIGLMDGGIFDNQGIESLMLSDDRMESSPDLLIISDVTSNTGESFSFKDGQKVSEITLEKMNLIIKIVVALCLTSSFSLLYQLFKGVFDGDFRPFYTITHLGVPLILSVFTAALIIWLRRKIITIAKQIPMIGDSLWDDIKKLTVNQVADAFTLRITSIFTVATEVMTTRVRNLIYRVFYLNRKYENRRISNLLSTLAIEKLKADLPEEIGKPSKLITEMANRAFEVKSAAWTERIKDQNNLICTGQFTTCYNLLRFIIRVYGRDTEKYPEEYKLLWDMLVEDWSSFQVAPDTLYQKLKTKD